MNKNPLFFYSFSILLIAEAFIILPNTFVGIANARDAESVVITTYYPSPSGVYNELTANKLVVREMQIPIYDPDTGEGGLRIIDDRPENKDEDPTNDVAVWLIIDSAVGGSFRGDLLLKKTGFGDIAELMPCDNCKAGDVVVVDSQRDTYLSLSNAPYDQNVAGVVSANPTYYANNITKESHNSVPLTLTGVVKCNVTADNGAIKRGNLLVTSSKRGHAMKGDTNKIKFGMIVGKALQNLEKDDGQILILIK